MTSTTRQMPESRCQLWRCRTECGLEFFSQYINNQFTWHRSLSSTTSTTMTLATTFSSRDAAAVGQSCLHHRILRSSLKQQAIKKTNHHRRSWQNSTCFMDHSLSRRQSWKGRGVGGGIVLMVNKNMESQSFTSPQQHFTSRSCEHFVMLPHG